MRTTTSLITREIFSLSTMLLVVLPLLMHAPAGGTSMLDKAEYSVAQVVGSLPVDSYRNLLDSKANSFKFVQSSKAGGLTAGNGPIFLNYSY